MAGTEGSVEAFLAESVATLTRPFACDAAAGLDALSPADRAAVRAARARPSPPRVSLTPWRAWAGGQGDCRREPQACQGLGQLLRRSRALSRCWLFAAACPRLASTMLSHLPGLCARCAVIADWEACGTPPDRGCTASRRRLLLKKLQQLDAAALAAADAGTPDGESGAGDSPLERRRGKRERDVSDEEDGAELADEARMELIGR